jgi:hypothetical protein
MDPAGSQDPLRVCVSVRCAVRWCMPQRRVLVLVLRVRAAVESVHLKTVQCISYTAWDVAAVGTRVHSQRACPVRLSRCVARGLVGFCRGPGQGEPGGGGLSVGMVYAWVGMRSAQPHTAACCWSAVQAMIERGHLKPPARLQLRGVEVVLCVQQGAHRTAWSCPPDTRCHARPCLQCSPASWA